MKLLIHHLREEAFADEASARAGLEEVREFTGLHRQVTGQPPARREAALLAFQIPRMLRPPESGDVVTGRVRYPLAGVSPEPMGLGLYFDFPSIGQRIKDPVCSESERKAWVELSAYWQGKTTEFRVRAAFPPDVSEKLPSDHWTDEPGVAFPLYRIGGVTLDYAKLLERGLDGLEEEAAAVSGNSDFRDGAVSVIRLVREAVHAQAEAAADPELKWVLEAIQHHPPVTLRQAIQLMWIYTLLAGTCNYGRLDVILSPFLDRDLRHGRLTREQALDLLCDFWRRMHDYANQYNHRVWIGGRGRPDPEAADRFALLAIEATRRVRLNQPQLSLRFHRDQNPDLWERALDAIGEGCTFPMLYNDDVNIPALASAFEVPESLACEYTPFGCGEAGFSHHSLTTPNGVINLLQALNVALHGGKDPVTGRLIQSGVPDPQELENFEAVWKAYTRVVEPHVAALARQQKIEYGITAEDSPLLLISLLTEDCTVRGKTLLDGGIRHLGGTLETYGNTNTADSLLVIDELVFRHREVSLPDLVKALDADFAGHEILQRKCLAVAKYGNDEGLADEMAWRVHRHICGWTRQQAPVAGLDSYLVVVVNNWANTVLGKLTGASAEGRHAGAPMANANNPTPGSDTAGVTAFLNSLVRLDSDRHAGTVQNMKFSREWFGGNRPKFDALLRAYFANGGTQAMITVVSRDDLEAAMREPEKWGHLMVRVGGFSIRFVELPPDAQREVLERTLH